MQLWRNWHTRKTKDLVSLARTGSSPVNCIFLMHIIRKNKIEYAVVAELAWIIIDSHDIGIRMIMSDSLYNSLTHNMVR